MGTDAVPVSADAVRAQLGRMLASDLFVSSRRLCRFLRFIVERTLESNTERLKEFVVAMEVFDRDERYDPNVDSIVRVEARRLRSKLKAYYEGEGRADPVVIALRPGSYVPDFHAASGELFPVAAAPRWPGAAAGSLTVAVLPFVNISPEPEQDYFCDGMTEEIINRLASVEKLNVIARTSAFQFKGKNLDVREVGERLGATVVVEGSVRKAGNQLRITAQAIETARGMHLWSETYRRELRDVFAMQEEISAAIAATLEMKLRPDTARTGVNEAPPLDAYSEFLKGMFLIHQQNPGGVFAALERFRELTRLHPGYAQPFAGVALAQGFLALFGIVPGRTVAEEMRSAAEAAVRVHAGCAEGWAALGFSCAHLHREWEAGDQHFQRAIALQPANAAPRAWYAMALAMQGLFPAAEAELLTAIRLNPLAAVERVRLGYVHYLAGDGDRAREQYEAGLGIQPDLVTGRLFLALLLMQREQWKEAAEGLSEYPERTPQPLQEGLLAAACFRMGDARRGEARLGRLTALAERQYVTPLAFAYVHMARGETDGAFARLEQAIEDRTAFANFTAVDPYFAPLRKESRFAKIRRLLRLPG